MEKSVSTPKSNWQLKNISNFSILSKPVGHQSSLKSLNPVFGAHLIQTVLRESSSKHVFPSQHQNQSVNQPVTSSKIVNSALAFPFWKKSDTISRSITKNSSDGDFKRDEAVSETEINETNGVPWIVSKCISEVDNRGLQEVGIYRLSGSAGAIKNLKNLFDNSIIIINDQ